MRSLLSAVRRAIRIGHRISPFGVRMMSTDCSPGEASIDPSLATLFKPEGAVNRERDIEDAELSKIRGGALCGSVGIGTGRLSDRQSSRKNEEKLPHLIHRETISIPHSAGACVL